MSTVLIVDDDPSHLKLYSWVLQRGGFRPLAALVQRETVQLPETEPIDLAVLDYQVGQVSAVEIAKRLRSSYPNAPIVVLSDMLWMPDDIAPYAVGFVRKGEPEQLLQAISSALNHASEEQSPGSAVAK